MVIACGSWAEPKIPFEVGGNSRLVARQLQSLRPPLAGTIGDHVDLADRADRAAFEQFDQPQIAGMLVVLGSHLSCDPFFASQPRDEARFLDGVRKRLLAVNMQAAAEGADSGRGVMVIGGADDDGFEIFPLQQLAIVEELFGLGKAAGCCV